MQYRRHKNRTIRSTSTRRGKPLRACVSLVKRSLRSGLLLVAALVMVVAALGSSQQAMAATKTTTLQPAEQAQSFAYFKALRTCMENGFYRNSVIIPPTMSQQNAIDFDWFNGFRSTGGTNGINVGAFNDPRGVDGDGRQNCGDGEGRAWISKAARLWGYSSGPALLCDLGFTRENSNGILCTDTSAGATNDFKKPSGSGKAAMDAFWKDKLGNASLELNSITPTGGAYRMYLDSVMSQCRLSTSGTTYSIQVYDEVAKEWSTEQFGAPDRDRNPGYSVTVWDQKNMTCAELAAAIGAQDSAAVTGYKDWLKRNNGNSEKDPPGGGEICKEDPSAPGCDVGEGVSSCGIPTLGWILCPVLTSGAAIADGAYDFVADNFLETNIGIVNTDPNRTDPATGKQVGTGAYIAWGIMRSIANIAFIIVFLIVIFSQMSNAGISNYGVKKMLPRLIVGAILVNVSFFICQIAVDLSNVLGYSLKGLFEGVASQVNASTGGTPASPGDDRGNLAGIAVTVLAATGFAWINASALIVAVAGAVVSLLTIFVILIVRQVLIVLLIVIAPLAFVAYMLPNTQALFDKWRKMLTTLLLLFPLIGLLYGASILASAIILQIAGDNMVWKIAGYMALVIPLLAIFPLLKGALDGVGKLGGAIQSFGSKARSSAQSGTQKGYDRSRLGQFKKYRSGVIDRRRAQIDGGTFEGSNRNPLNWARKARSAVNRKVVNPLSGQFGQDLAASGAELVDQEAEREIKSATALMTQQRLSSGELTELARGREVRRDGKVIMRAPDDTMRQAAVREKMKTGTTGEVERLLAGSADASAKVRQEMARGIHSNGHVAKADYLGGDFADRVLRGEIRSDSDLDDAAARRIEGGKLSAETMVAQDADALQRLARISGEASAGARTDISSLQIDHLRDTAVEASTNDQYRAKITGQKAIPIDLITRL